MKVCEIDGCERPSIARNWCNLHYRRWRRALNQETLREQGRALYAANLDKYRKKAREQKRRWREKDPEPNREAARRWRADNPELARERAQRWRQANPDKTREYSRQARLKNVAYRTEANRRRDARKRLEPFEVFTDHEIFERDGWICQLCRAEVDPCLKSPNPKAASLDHIIPLSQNGRHLRANVQLAHRGCNSSKNYRTVASGEQLRLIG